MADDPYDNDDLRRANMHEPDEAEPERQLPRGFFEAKDWGNDEITYLIRVDDLARVEANENGDSCRLVQHGEEFTVQMSYEAVIRQMIRHGQ